MSGGGAGRAATIAALVLALLPAAAGAQRGGEGQLAEAKAAFDKRAPIAERQLP